MLTTKFTRINYKTKKKRYMWNYIFESQTNGTKFKAQQNFHILFGSFFSDLFLFDLNEFIFTNVLGYIGYIS